MRFASLQSRLHQYPLIAALSLLLVACGGDNGVEEESSTGSGSGGAGSAQETALQKALRTGDARYVDDPLVFIDSALNSIAGEVSAAQALKAQLFNLSSNGEPRSDGSSLTGISWDPTHDAALLKATFGLNHELLFTNSVTNSSYSVQELPIAIAGEKAGVNHNARFLALGSNPMRNSYTFSYATTVSQDMHQFLENSIAWLAGRQNFSEQPLKVVIAQMGQSQYFPDRDASRAWLGDHYPDQVSFNLAGSCDKTALASCLNDDVDLLIISQVTDDNAQNGAVESAVASWLAAGKPVLYLHHDGNHSELGKLLFKQLDVGYYGDNYWRKLQLENVDPGKFNAAVPSDIDAIAQLLQRFKDNSFSIDLSACDDKSCPDSSGFNSQFQSAATIMRSMFHALDQQKVRLFDSYGYIFQKSVLLLADHYRQLARFPMDKDTTAAIDFLQSYFADHAVYNLRDINPAQFDLGNFSRSDFSHVTPVNKQVAMTSKRHFRAAGVYALPGQTVTVTRTDNSAVGTTVFINTLRSGATHQFSKNGGYSRPKHLNTVALSIAPGETLSFTSSHGGPIQIGFDSNDQAVTFSFQNVGEHPYWGSSADNNRFATALVAGDYDWAEVSTAGFEVHSKLDKMKSSLNAWSDAAALAAATERYMSNFPHVLAGFQGPGIDVVPEIHDFASARGWTIDTIDLVKHMNADQATCGYGCSGNPYDAYWAFGPVDHGDLHELGHGLERGRFRFAGWDGHASTNPYSYYSKSQYHKDTGNNPSCQELVFDTMKTTLEESRQQADPFAYMQAAGLNGWKHGVGIYIQMMMSAQAEGVLQDGWHLLARLHVLEREFSRADDSDDSWAAKRNSLGFSQFSRAEARALSNNDWLAIALSTVTGRDMRDYLRMWGLGFSDAASNQIAGLLYPPMPKKFFDSSNAGYCENMSPSWTAIL